MLNSVRNKISWKQNKIEIYHQTVSINDLWFVRSFFSETSDFKLCQEVLKFYDICLSCSLQKTDLEMNF